MSDSRPGTLSTREVQQLQLSLQSKSIREVALTVCTIRGLASEVKSILRDLCQDEVAHNLPSPRPRPRDPPYVLPMAPPNPYQQIQSVNSFTSLSTQPYSTIQKSGFARLLAKRGRRRHRCSQCPRTFSAQSSVWRHVKTHHTGHAREYEPKPAPLNPENTCVSPVASAPSMEILNIESPKAIDMPGQSNQPDTSVATPRQISVMSDEIPSSVASPLPSSQPASSPEDHLSPMPAVGDLFGVDSVKPEPSDFDNRPLELDADMEIISPIKTQFTENDASHSLSMMFPSPTVTSRNNEDQIRAAIDAQLMDVPVDGMYQCSDCGWRSKSSSSMRSHMLSHKGILPFSCDICNYKTNKKHVLTRHYTVHTGEKPHKCPICSFGSLDHVELLKHMTKTHPGVHPFTCTICGHHATTNTLLKKHMKSDHSMTPPRQSPSSSRPQPGEAHSSTSCSGLAKNSKPRNVLSSSSETIYATSSINQPVFP